MGVQAQAIMLLAGNGHPTTPSATIPASPVAPNKLSILESFVVNCPYATATTTPRRSSPVSSNSAPHSLGWSATINTLAASKQGGVLSSSSRVETHKVVNLPSTVPQFRRKSLARFLEKRKERVISTKPYANKESPDCNSSGSCPVQAVN